MGCFATILAVLAFFPFCPDGRGQLEPTEPDLWLEEPGDLLPALGLPL